MDDACFITFGIANGDGPMVFVKITWTQSNHFSNTDASIIKQIQNKHLPHVSAAATKDFYFFKIEDFGIVFLDARVGNFDYQV